MFFYFRKKLRDIQKSLIEGSNFFCVHTVRDKKCVTSVHCIVTMLDSDPAKEVFFLFQLHFYYRMQSRSGYFVHV